MTVSGPRRCIALTLTYALLGAPFAANAQAETPQAGSSPKAEPQATATATLQVYRPKRFVNGGIKPGIVVDDIEYAALPSHGCMSLSIPAGAHTLGLKLSDRYEGESRAPFTAESGRTVYAVVETGIVEESAYTSSRLFTVAIVPETVARAEMDCGQWIDPVSGKKHRKSRFLFQN